MYNWSLDALYLDFDEVFLEDFKTLESLLKTSLKLAETLEGMESLENWLNHSVKLNTLVRNLASYTNYRLSTNANDPQANQYMGQLQGVVSAAARPEAIFKKWLKSNESQFDSWVKESALIQEHEFILREDLEFANHTLSEDAEEIISKMKINASSLWSHLQTQLTASKTIQYNNETHTLTSLRNLAYHSDPKIRKEAYEKELELYSSMDDAIAFALNGIKGEVIQTATLRNFKSPLEETLMDSRLSMETLHALITAIENKLPDFRRYLQHKAKLLGHDSGLPFYDLFAPYTLEESKKYTVEDSKQIIVDNFKTFSDDLAALATRAYDENWIDFYPKEGKQGGAYCSNLPHLKQSRIFTNYGEGIADIVTLAHELGHAYHGHMLEDNSILNTGYTMPVAETASTFCENIIFNASLTSATDEEKIMLIENSLQDLTQITVDILSRYKFETEVFHRRKNELLDSKALQNIMLKAQKDTYGDGLNKDQMHPFMWINKGHYYSAGRNFYNFPYAFGGLFALGLYAQYEKEGSSFVDKYRALLKKTASASCEDVAKMADVDTTSVSFWESSLDQVVKRIDLYIELTHEKIK